MTSYLRNRVKTSELLVHLGRRASFVATTTKKNVSVEDDMPLFVSDSGELNPGEISVCVLLCFLLLPPCYITA